MTTPHPALTLRPEISRDKEFSGGLYRSTREDLLQLNLPESILFNMINMQFNAQQHSYWQHFPEADFSIIEKNGEPIGRLITHDSAAEIRLVYIALLPQERNRGFGRYLLRVLQEAATCEKKPLTLSVDAMNGRAQHLYMSMGFQVFSNGAANLEMIWHPTFPELGLFAAEPSKKP